MELASWSEDFEWFEQEPLTYEQIESLSVEERIQREFKLAKILTLFKGRWVLVKNQDVIASGSTPAKIIARKRRLGVSRVQWVPEDDGHDIYDQAA